MFPSFSHLFLLHEMWKQNRGKKREKEREDARKERSRETKKVINETSDRASKAFISITFIAVIIMKYVLEY